MRISDWSSDVCSSDLHRPVAGIDLADLQAVGLGVLLSRHDARDDDSVELFAQRHQLLDLQADRRQRRGEFVARGVGGDVLAEPVFAEFHCFGTRSCCSPQKGRAFTSPSRSEEHTSELQSLMRISYAVFCLKKKNM